MSSDCEDSARRLVGSLGRKPFHASNSAQGGKGISPPRISGRPEPEQQVCINFVEEKGSAAKPQVLDGALRLLARWLISAAHDHSDSGACCPVADPKNPLDVAPEAKVGSKGR